VLCTDDDAQGLVLSTTLTRDLLPLLLLLDMLPPLVLQQRLGVHVLGGLAPGAAVAPAQTTAHTAGWLLLMPFPAFVPRS
jgi:hypothetical protein